MQPPVPLLLLAVPTAPHATLAGSALTPQSPQSKYGPGVLPHKSPDVTTEVVHADMHIEQGKEGGEGRGGGTGGVGGKGYGGLGAGR